MIRTRVLGALALAAVATLGACRSPDAADACMLQIQALAARDSLAVGDSVKLFALTLPLLPPGGGCGQAAITWSLSDSTLASLAATGESDAVLTARRPGTVTASAHGIARGHQADAAVTLTIAPQVLVDGGGFLSITAHTSPAAMLAERP